MNACDDMYCLPVLRCGNHFTPDRDLSVGGQQWLLYALLRDHLARHHRKISAHVEIGGVVQAAQVFEAQLQDDMSYALVDVSGQAARMSSAFVTAWQLLSSYLQRLAARLSYSEAFPPTYCSYLPSEFIEPQFRVLNNRGEPGTPVSWSEVMTSARFVILGSPGSGKTACLRMLALEEASRTESDDARRLPVYVQLRHLSSDLDVLMIAKRTLEWADDGSWWQIVASGRLMLIFDGFDEMAPSRRDWLRHQLQQATEQHPEVGFALSSRASEFDLDLPGFLLAQLEPFDTARQREWIERRIARSGKGLVRDLMTLIFERRSLSTLCGNPLLLATMAACVEREKQVPRRAGTVLLKYIEGLIDDWDDSRGIQRWSPISFSKQRKLSLLCRTAFRTVQQERSFFRKDEFLAWEAQWSTGDGVQSTLETLWRHSGLLLPESDDAWRFSHATIKEVLAAKYLIDTPDDALAAMKAVGSSESLRSVWLYACEMATDASSMVHFMIYRAEEPEETRVELVTRALLGEINIPRDVLSQACEFVASRIGGLCRLLRVIRTDETTGRWAVELEPRHAAVPADLLQRLKAFVQTIGLGLHAERRQFLAQRIGKQGNEACEALGRRIATGGAVKVQIDVENARFLIEGEVEREQELERSANVVDIEAPRTKVVPLFDYTGLSSALGLPPIEPVPARMRLSRRAILAGTIAAGLSGFGIEALRRVINPGQPDVIGGGHVLRLPLNGGVMHAARNSVFRIVGGDAAQTVHLRSGQIAFELWGGVRMLTRVLTPLGEIAVTAARFGVLALESMLQVTVTEGSVRVVSPDTRVAGVVLTAGQKLTFRSQMMYLASIVPGAAEREFAWTAGALYFHGESLLEAAATFNRFNLLQIVPSPAIAHLSVGIQRCAVGDPQRFIDRVVASEGLASRTTGNVIRVFGRDEVSGAR